MTVTFAFGLPNTTDPASAISYTLFGSAFGLSFFFLSEGGAGFCAILVSSVAIFLSIAFNLLKLDPDSH